MYRKHIIVLSSIPVFRQKNTRRHGRAIFYLMANIGHTLHSGNMPALYRKGQAIGSKSLPQVCASWRVVSGSVHGVSLPRRVAIYSDRCALFLALHLRAFSLYLALLFFRQSARYSFVELGGCLLIPSPLFFELWIMFAVVAWVHVCVNVPVFADYARVFDLKVILHICPPPSVRNTTHSASMPSAPLRVRVAACVGLCVKILTKK